jgi:DNA-binding transcriptional LysR family regulator
MDVRHLELLRDLAEHGSITAVARATHRTPSAVSQQLRTAQRELGARLVERDGRGIRLTEAGRLLAAQAATVAAALAEAQAEWDAYRGGPAGEVSVLALPSTAEYLLPPVVARFQGSPIRVRLSDEDVAEDAWPRLTRDHDIVIGHSLRDLVPRWGEQVVLTRLAREPLDIAVPADHPLAAREQLEPEELVDESWVGVPPGFPFDTVLQAIERRTGQALRVVQRLRDNRLVEALVARGIGLAVLPRFTTRPRPDLVLRPLARIDTARHVFAFQRPDRARRLAVRRVLDAIRETAEEVTAQSSAGSFSASS